MNYIRSRLSRHVGTIRSYRISLHLTLTSYQYKYGDELYMFNYYKFIIP